MGKLPTEDLKKLLKGIRRARPEARDKVEAVLSQNGVDVRFLGSFTKGP